MISTRAVIDAKAILSVIILVFLIFFLICCIMFARFLYFTSVTIYFNLYLGKSSPDHNGLGNIQMC